MSADATNAPGLSEGLPDAGVQPTLTERARQVVAAIEDTFREIWRFFRFLFFVGFLLLATLAFWLWALSAVLGLFRLVLGAITWLFLWLAGGTPPRPGPPVGVMEGIQQDLRRMWERRTIEYEAIARPLARHLVTAGHLGRTFWHWPWFNKAFAVAVLALTVVVPALYVVPRPHEVQITDDNAVEYDKTTNKTTYLVHALDMRDAAKHREYRNEDAWYLGKINSQGLKSQLQIGRMYRLWVVGVRWYYMPTLYPNIISATEIDEQGHAITHPRRLAVPAEAPAPAKP